MEKGKERRGQKQEAKGQNPMRHTGTPPAARGFGAVHVLRLPSNHRSRSLTSTDLSASSKYRSEALGSAMTFILDKS